MTSSNATLASLNAIEQLARNGPALNRYMDPNGQIPAYEWNLSDVNPPVTAWAPLFVHDLEAGIRGEGDRDFLARVFRRLLTNFTCGTRRTASTTT